MSKKRISKDKFIFALTALIVSAVMLSTATYAWFTLSTNPEIKGMQFTAGADETMLISIDEGQTFHRTVDLSELMASDMNVLRPVSTYDGLNWYVCDYDIATGNILENEFFLLDWCEDPRHGEEGYEHHCVNGRSYNTELEEVVDSFYAYTDIWVKSESDECEIRLSIPLSDDDYKDEIASGSYVLSYDVVEREDGKQAVQILSRGPETCARIGLMVFTPTPSDAASHVVLDENEDAKGKSSLIENFYIYEPNADVRSELDKQDSKYFTDIYVSMLKIKGFTALDYDKTTSAYDSVNKKYNLGDYIPTYPIKATGTLTENEDFTLTTAAAPFVFDSSNLLVQTGAYWDKAEINQAASDAGNTLLNYFEGNTNLFEIKNGPLDIIESLMKNDYIVRGSFISDTSALYGKTAGAQITTQNDGYAPVDILDTQTSATSQVMFNLKKGEVRQIRVFFWIEGQDIDCWNDVAGMNFLTRLEFATTVTK